MEEKNITNAVHKLEADNDKSGFQIKIFDSDGKENSGCDFIDVKGLGFKNADALSSLPINSLSLSNTQIKSLDFLKKGIINTTLKSVVILQNNKLLHSYNGLKSVTIHSLHILNCPGFNNISVINPSVRGLYLVNTAIRNLSFPNPESIEYLTLVQNRELIDYEPIGKLSNLSRLEIDCLKKADLTKLKKLKYFTLSQSSAETFPELPNHKFEMISIFLCDNLSSIDMLKGVSVRKVSLTLTDSQLVQFSPILQTMQIEELKITYTPRETTLVEESLKKIKGLKNLKFNGTP